MIICIEIKLKKDSNIIYKNTVEIGMAFKYKSSHFIFIFTSYFSSKIIIYQLL